MSEWIPVAFETRESPEQDVEVLCQLLDGSFHVLSYHEGDDDCGWSCEFPNGHVESFGFYEVKAWMPLPQPYEGEA